MTSFAPGTQWSQNARLSLPAAWAPRTKGAAARAVVAIAAVPSTRRRVIVFSAILPFLEAGPLLGDGGYGRFATPMLPEPVRLAQNPARLWQKQTRGRDNGHRSRQQGCRIGEKGAGASRPLERSHSGAVPSI